MTTLNAAWMLSTFIMAAQQTMAGTFIEADTSIPEMKELIARKYVKTNKKLLNDGTKLGGVAVAGAYAEDLIADLGLDPNEYLHTIPVDLRKPVAETVPEIATVDAAPVVADATPAPTVPEMPAFAGATETMPTTAVQEQPTFHAQEQAPAQEQSAAPAPVVGGHVAPQIVETVTRRDKEIAIAVGIAYHNPQSGAARTRAAATPQEEAYPYKEIVDLKVAHPNEAPSFHITGKKSKDVSGMLRRHAEKYEKSHGITFRAQTVDATDPNGAGVRVFALTVAEAPKRPVRNKKADADQAN